MNIESNYNITYILGAGASADNDALPVVADYTKRLRRCAERVATVTCDHVHVKFIVKYIESLKWLADEGDKHKTVDSFARFCYNNEEHEDLKRVKQTLIFFFAVEQFIFMHRDGRYNKFINTLIKNHKFPKNINIINWNYDFQFQLACDLNKRKEAYQYCEDGECNHTPGILFYYPSLTEKITNACDPFQMVQMNGIAGFYKSEMHRNTLRHLNVNGRIKSINDLLQILQDEPASNHLFNFAFEETENGHAIDDRIKIAQQMIEKTDVLVIIGYSFAPENNDVDQMIFSSKEARNRIERIYIQDPLKDGSDLISKLGFPNKGSLLQPIRQLGAFHIPDEHYRIKNVFDNPMQYTTGRN